MPKKKYPTIFTFSVYIMGSCSKSRTSFRYGQNTDNDFRYLWNYKRYEKVDIKASKHLQKLWKIPKFEGPGLKTKPATLICILDSKGPSFAQFWSYKKMSIIFFHQKIISIGVCFTSFCSQINRFWNIFKNAQSRLLSTPQVERICQNLSTWG